MEPRIKTQDEINRTRYRSPAYPCPSPEEKVPTTPPTTKPPVKPPEEKAIEKSLRAIEETLRSLLRTQGDVIYLLQELVRASETELVDLKLDSGLQNLPNPVTTVPSPDDINPLTGYTRIIVHDILDRTSPELYFLNQGPGTVFIRMSKNGKAFSESESVVFEGEVKTFYDVYELRVRTTTANTNYRVTEFEYLKQRDISFLAGIPFVSQLNVVVGVPVTLDIVSDPIQGLGKNAHTGFVINDGPNNLQVELSNVGPLGPFAPIITVIPNQILDLNQEDMAAIRLSVLAGNANYRLAVH